MALTSVNELFEPFVFIFVFCAFLLCSYTLCLQICWFKSTKFFTKHIYMFCLKRVHKLLSGATFFSGFEADLVFMILFLIYYYLHPDDEEERRKRERLLKFVRSRSILLWLSYPRAGGEPVYCSIFMNDESLETIESVDYLISIINSLESFNEMKAHGMDDVEVKEFMDHNSGVRGSLLKRRGELILKERIAPIDITFDPSVIEPSWWEKFPKSLLRP